MKKIKLEELNDIIISNIDVGYFAGYNVTEHKDVNGLKYELKDEEEQYYFLGKFHDSKVFVSESHLLHMLLGEYIDDIESRDIYAHGYPEGRLIPSDHHEKCQEYFLEKIQEEIAEKVDNAVSHYFY